MATLNCPQCGNIFDHSDGLPGRRPTYCSGACRKLAYEHRRAATATGQAVQFVHVPGVEKVIERSRIVYVKPELNDLAQAMEETPELMVSVFASMRSIFARERKPLTKQAQERFVSEVLKVVQDLHMSRAMPWGSHYTGTLDEQQWTTVIAAADALDGERAALAKEAQRLAAEKERLAAQGQELALRERRLREDRQRLADDRAALERTAPPPPRTSPGSSFMER